MSFKLEPGDVIVERDDTQCRWLYIGPEKWLMNYGVPGSGYRENCYAIGKDLDDIESYENGRAKDVYRDGVKVYPAPVEDTRFNRMYDGERLQPNDVVKATDCGPTAVWVVNFEGRWVCTSDARVYPGVSPIKHWEVWRDGVQIQ